MAAVGRLLVVLVLACALASACAGPSPEDQAPAPTSTPIARAVPVADGPPTTEMLPPKSTPTAPADTNAPADGGLEPSAAQGPLTPAAEPLEPTPSADAPSDSLPPSWSLRTVGGSRRVPILMYHYIRVNPVPTDRLGFGLSVTPADFEAQMSYLEGRGYHSVTISDIASGAAFRDPGRAVAITFDDGYEDAYTTAYPILKSHGYHATFYVITDFIGRPRYMTWDQVRALAAAGEVIGSHTESHPDLTRLDAVSLYAQLAISQLTLETQLGQPVLDFCYPAGRFNPRVREMVARVGYRTATTTREGLVRPGDDLLTLPRVRVSGGLTLDAFATLIEGRLPGPPTRAPVSTRPAVPPRSPTS